MPKNSHTSRIRKAERAQIARQEKEAIEIAKRLAREIAEPVPAPAINADKARRSLRLAHKRKHKTVRNSAGAK